VFQLPTTCFAEEDGSLVNSGALAAMALEGRGRRRARPSSDIWIMPASSTACGAVSQGGRRVPRSDPEPDLGLHRSRRAGPEEMAKEMNGRALADLKDANGKVW
jgi:formate dehydrogenase major subunit